jgi:benzoate/toluate 1,2-dioxygenase reductase subunit
MSNVPVTLLFADGVAQSLHVPIGEKIITVSANAGLSLLTDCCNGQCGTCSAQLLVGTVDLDNYDRLILSDDEREEGAILACVSRAREACVIEFPYDFSEVSTAQQPARAARIVCADMVAESTLRLEVELDDAPAFLPGQYVRLRQSGGTEWRSYSMANISGQSRLTFYIRVIPEGRFSGWATTAAKPGDMLEVGSPRGTFFLRDEDRPRLFVAGGTGLAPFLSMLRSLGNDERHRNTPTHLILGARTAEHLFGINELEQLQAELPNFSFDVAVESGASSNWRQGYATDLIGRLPLDPATRVYLCGPPPMVEAGKKAVSAAGFSAADVLCERFA